MQSAVAAEPCEQMGQIINTKFGFSQLLTELNLTMKVNSILFFSIIDWGRAMLVIGSLGGLDTVVPLLNHCCTAFGSK